MKQFVITGLGRSGTGYMARLLAALGVHCGHEQVYGLRTTQANWCGPPTGDSSWLAAPHIAQLDPDVQIIHLYRQPMAWMRSWCQAMPPEVTSAYSDFVARYYSYWADDTLTHFEKMLRLWVDWNALVSQGASSRSTSFVESSSRYCVLRIEDVPGQLGALLTTLEVERSLAEQSKALSMIPRNYNTAHGKPQRQFTWDMFDPSKAEHARFVAHAALIGYTSFGQFG